MLLNIILEWLYEYRFAVLLTVNLIVYFVTNWAIAITFWHQTRKNNTPTAERVYIFMVFLFVGRPMILWNAITDKA